MEAFNLDLILMKRLGLLDLTVITPAQFELKCSEKTLNTAYVSTEKLRERAFDLFPPASNNDDLPVELESKINLQWNNYKILMHRSTN